MVLIVCFLEYSRYCVILLHQPLFHLGKERYIDYDQFAPDLYRKGQYKKRPVRDSALKLTACVVGQLVFCGRQGSWWLFPFENEERILTIAVRPRGCWFDCLSLAGIKSRKCGLVMHTLHTVHTRVVKEHLVSTNSLRMLCWFCPHWICKGNQCIRW